MAQPEIIYTTEQAPGALPNGTLIEKVNSKPGDAHPDGSRGTIIGSWGPFDDESFTPVKDETKEKMRRSGVESCDYFYFIVWRDMPGCPVGIAGSRIEPDWGSMTEGEAMAAIGFRPAVKEGELGLEKDDLFIPSLKEGECPDFVVGSPDPTTAVRGSVTRSCSRCGAETVIAPHGQEVLGRCPETKLICLTCCVEEMEVGR